MPRQNMTSLQINKGTSELLDMVRNIDIDVLEKGLLKIEQAECPVVHSFSPGLYIKEVTLPTGAFCIGHHQKKAHLNILIKGKIVMLAPDGSEKELSAPMMFTGQPGKKMGYVLDEVVWVNIYPTEETDVEKLEEMYLDKSETLEDLKASMVTYKDTEDNKDYRKLLTELDVTEEQVRLEVENKEDQIPMPHGSYSFGIFKSNIEGKGIFATANIEVGQSIGPARIGDNRTPIGRYTNHSVNPNAKMVNINGNIYLEALVDIPGQKGGLKGDEITTNYRSNRKVAQEVLECHQ